MAYRWLVLLCIIDPAARPPFVEIMRIFFVSTFVGTFLPASVGGDAVLDVTVVLLDAGHLCQTFCLVATWLGLAPFCTAALKDTVIETDLGIDGIGESILYIAGVGPQPDSQLRR